jgi:hypothetical protein
MKRRPRPQVGAPNRDEEAWQLARRRAERDVRVGRPGVTNVTKRATEIYPKCVELMEHVRHRRVVRGEVPAD